MARKRTASKVRPRTPVESHGRMEKEIGQFTWDADGKNLKRRGELGRKANLQDGQKEGVEPRQYAPPRSERGVRKGKRETGEED